MISKVSKLTKKNKIIKLIHANNHPGHKKELIKLKRAQGQLTGIMGMIEENRYCPDILIQIRAAKSALQSVEHSILKTHLEHCVHDAINAKDSKDINNKIHELVEMIGRHI
jgi:DNA-binding FrmR family transcriptional regulator